MSKLSLQFHAMPEEITALMDDLFTDQAVSVVEAVGVPIKFGIWDGTQRGGLSGERRAFAFTLKPPNLEASRLDEFRQFNPDALVLDIGQMTSAGLSESWLSAMTDNGTAMKRWRRAARHARASMLTGAMAVNPKSGVTAPMREHRFTVKAQQAFARGIAMLPAAGNTVIKLPPPMGDSEEFR